MAVDVGGVASEVLVGSAILRVAPITAEEPTLDGTTPITWPTGWRKVGYTESGTQYAYAPTFKDIMVDEEKSPVQSKLDSEKETVSAQLAQATLENISLAISGGTFDDANKTATTTKAGYKTLKTGGGDAVEMKVALEGVNEEGLTRVILGHRVQTRANIQLAFKRADKTLVPVEFQALADSAQSVGERGFVFYDETEAPTGS